VWVTLLKLLGTLFDGVLKILPLLIVSKKSKDLGKAESEIDSLKTINEVNLESTKIIKDAHALSDDELYDRLYNKN
jgi:hypothetical protein